MRRITLIIIVLSFSATLSAQMRNAIDSKSNSDAVAGPVLELSTDAIIFENVEVGIGAIQYYQMYNRGDMNLNIYEWGWELHIFDIDIETLNIAPGDSAPLEAIFNPTNDSGYAVTVYIESNAGRLEFPMTGNLNDATVGIHPHFTRLPNSFDLKQNFPNPFNPSTAIEYALPEISNVRLVIYDIRGDQVEILLNETQNAGSYQFEWNASGYASGIYFYELVAGSFSETKKMLLLK